MIWLQSIRFLRLSDESINRLMRIRKRHFFQWLKRPPLFSFLKVDLTLWFDRSFAFTRIRSTQINPFRKVRDHLIRQLAGWWHLHAIIFHGFEQQTFSGVALYQCGTSLAASSNTGR